MRETGDRKTAASRCKSRIIAGGVTKKIKEFRRGICIAIDSG